MLTLSNSLRDSQSVENNSHFSDKRTGASQFSSMICITLSLGQHIFQKFLDFVIGRHQNRKSILLLILKWFRWIDASLKENRVDSKTCMNVRVWNVCSKQELSLAYRIVLYTFEAILTQILRNDSRWTLQRDCILCLLRCRHFFLCNSTFAAFNLLLLVDVCLDAVTVCVIWNEIVTFRMSACMARIYGAVSSNVSYNEATSTGCPKVCCYDFEPFHSV